MANRLPVFSDKRKICIICEGDEEYDYLKRLNCLNVWNKEYEITLDNADGNGNIPYDASDEEAERILNYLGCYESGVKNLLINQAIREDVSIILIGAAGACGDGVFKYILDKKYNLTGVSDLVYTEKEVEGIPEF